jgi:hypothetical protein
MIRRKYLDFEGICQLIWAPRLVSLPGPKENILLRTYFAPVQPALSSDQQAKRLGASFFKDIPIGDAINIPIGTMFYDGMPISTAGIEDRDFSVNTSIFSMDFSSTNIRLIERWAEVGEENSQTRLLIPASPSSLPDDPHYNGTLLSVGSNGNPFAFLIPSFEVFRFFYAISSRMASVFLDSRFLEWARYVWNPNRSVIDPEKREARLWLRQWMLDQDAWFIASLAFDPEAIERGKDLYRAVATDSGRMLRAVPPMQGEVRIKAKWVGIQNGTGQESKIILHIISTDWQPPFTELKFDRDNDGRVIKKPEEQVKEKKPVIRRPRTRKPKQPFTNQEEDEVTDLTDEPGDPAEEEYVQIAEVNERFDWLSQANIEKLPQVETQFSGKKAIEEQEKRWRNELSTLDGTSSAATVRSVELTSEDLDLLDAAESQNGERDELDEVDADLTPPSDELLKIARALANINFDRTLKNVNVEFLSLWGEPLPIETFSFFRLPKTLQGEEYGWLYKTRSKRPRLALAAEITCRTENVGSDYEVRYVMDFEPNPNASSIVILAREDGQAIESSHLRRLIRGFAQTRSVKHDRSRIKGLQIGHRKHNISESVLGNGEDFLYRIFSTPLRSASDKDSLTQDFDED